MKKGMKKSAITWEEKYSLAVSYYQHKGNLEVPQDFKTFNGYDYDENGIKLGSWINNQRQGYFGNNSCKLTEKQVELLKRIGMRFYNVNNMDKWMEKYNLAASYFEHYGNLEVPSYFKTFNGYEHDEKGIRLGSWISAQRQAYKGNNTNKINEEQINLLKEIGMRFDNIDIMNNWMEKYNLAKAYYEHHGNLEVPHNFKTVNGYEYAEEGINLGLWINNEREAFKGTNNRKMTIEQIKLLSQINMRFNNIDVMDLWNQKYDLAKAYYEHHGNLEIKYVYSTTNGYEPDENGVKLGNWIVNQRKAYQGKGTYKINDNQVSKLEKIGMIWMGNTDNIKRQVEEITEENLSRKKVEILNRLRSFLSNYDGSILPSPETLNSAFIESLDSKVLKKKKI